MKLREITKTEQFLSIATAWDGLTRILLLIFWLVVAFHFVQAVEGTGFWMTIGIMVIGFIIPPIMLFTVLVAAPILYYIGLGVGLVTVFLWVTNGSMIPHIPDWVEVCSVIFTILNIVLIPFSREHRPEVYNKSWDPTKWTD